VPSCTALAPRTKAAATVRPSATPPAAMTDPHSIYHLWQEREEARLHAYVYTGEGATMSAGLGTLRDDSVDTPLLEHPRLGHGRGTGDDENAGAFNGVDNLPRRQAKMEAYHLWLCPHQHRQVFAAHFTRSTCWLGYNSEALRVEVRL